MATHICDHFNCRFHCDQLTTIQPKAEGAYVGTEIERPRLFSGISPTDYATIQRAARIDHFPRNEMLHLEGDPAERVLLLTSGLVKTTKIGQGGEEVILRLAGPGDFLGVEGLIWCDKHCSTAQAFRACRALVWKAQAFRELTKRFPVLHQNLGLILGEHLRELEDRFREVATEKVGPRVALQLLRLAKTVGRAVNGEVEIGLSREDLAQMTGTTLFTVSRLLSEWQLRGVVKPRRNAVVLCDIQSLRAIAQEE